MSRIISGKVRLDVHWIELSAVLNESIETLRSTAQAKGVRLQALLDPFARPIFGDPNRLQQVFWNLLNNAIKFTPKDGKVEVLLKHASTEVEVSVIDTGEGIAPEFPALHFRPLSARGCVDNSSAWRTWTRTGYRQAAG